MLYALVEQGKINLDEDIKKYVGEITITNHTGTSVTMRHLLTHTSGFDFTDNVSSNNVNDKQSSTIWITFYPTLGSEKYLIFLNILT
ncbi:serine hydrolase [Paenibacillus pabuli]|uniref:serine hydrolase n=1 Tax=Paenibacillus pabuli TaxID=1472 RepID=UPI003CF37127